MPTMVSELPVQDAFLPTPEAAPRTPSPALPEDLDDPDFAPGRGFARAAIVGVGCWVAVVGVLWSWVL